MVWSSSSSLAFEINCTNYPLRNPKSSSQMVNFSCSQSLSFRFFSISFYLSCFTLFLFADPIHSLAEQTRQDPSCQILRSSRGFRETQGRIRGNSNTRFHFLLSQLTQRLNLIFTLICQVHRLVVNRDPKYTNFVEVNFLSLLIII